MMDLLFLGLGMAIGFGTGWFSYRGRQVATRELAEEERLALERQNNALQIDQAKIFERYRMLEESFQSGQTELAQERQFNISLHAELSRERAGRNHLEQRIEHQKNDVSKLQERLTQEFKVLVEQVLEEKSQSLNDLNKSSLNSLLAPITEKLQDFKQKLEDQHHRETRELIVLHNKLANLESGRWPHHNGSTPSPTVAEPPPVLEPKPPDQAEEIAQYIPPRLDESAAVEDESPIITLVKPDALPESDGFHTFSPKQQVEIDNFLKRTLGRVQKKKSAK